MKLPTYNYELDYILERVYKVRFQQRRVLCSRLKLTVCSQPRFNSASAAANPSRHNSLQACIIVAKVAITMCCTLELQGKRPTSHHMALAKFCTCYTFPVSLGRPLLPFTADSIQTKTGQAVLRFNTNIATSLVI